MYLLKITQKNLYRRIEKKYDIKEHEIKKL